MRRLSLIVFAILLLGSAGFGLTQLAEIKKLKQNLSALDQERAALQKRIWDLQKLNGELENRLARAGRTATGGRAQAEPTGDAPPENEAPATGSWARGRNEVGRFAAVMASPEVQKLMAVQQKGALDNRYASLFKQLQLSPADLEKFKNLLVEKQSAVMDVMSAARADGLAGPGNRDQIRQLVQEAQAEVDNTIRSTLGDTAYAQYQGYEATLPERNVVTQLEQRLSYSTAPLSDAQSAQLVQILAQTAPPGAANSGGGGMIQMFAGALRGGAAGLPGGSTPITSDALHQAQTILSAQQLAALQGLQQEQQAAAQLRQQLRTNFSVPAAGASAPADSPPAVRPAGL